MPFLPAYSIFANSNLFLYIKKDTQIMGVYFGAEGEIPSARFCARRQAPGQRTVHRTVLTLSVCPFRISFFTSKKTPKIGCLFWRRRRDSLGSLLRSPTGTRTANSPQDCSNAARLSFSNLFLYIKKDTQKWVSFLAQKERFELSRRFPGLRP